MAMMNGEVVDLLQLIGDLMELRGDPPFKVRAYREAARNLDQVAGDIAAIAAENKLTDIRGIGSSIAATVKEYLAGGESRQLEHLRQEVPESLVELLGLRHFGPQRIVKVHQALGVATLDALEAAARDGRLEHVPGFGKKSVETLLESIAAFREQRNRVPRFVAESVGRTALHSLRQMANCGDVALVGGIRRLADTVDTVDLLAADDDPDAILDAFARLPLFRDVERDGAVTAAAHTRERYLVRLHVVAPRVWGAALQHFTGSAAHNAQLLERARAIGRTAPPPANGAPAGGEWQGAIAGADGTPIEGADEDAVYAALGLSPIPPELREGRGEIAAALTGTLPNLIRVEDIRGDLHLHTTWSDGKHSIEQMARKGRALGYEYVAIADHSQSLGVARGLNLERLAAQRREIHDADAALNGICLLSSVELDIKHDGALDYPDEVLAQFAFVTASIHSGFQQSREQLTNRVIAAMRSPHVDAIGHLTGRVLGRRPPLDLDVDAILDTAAETGTALEINAWPNRLDVHEETARRAKEMGIKLVINTDSHADDQMDYMHYGVEIARRAWLTAADVLNTLPLDALLAHLRGRPMKSQRSDPERSGG